MEAVFAVTAKLQLPAQLRERIHEYYEHLWHEYECLDGEIVQFSKELSHTLGLEVVLFKYMELVMHVPFWKECTPDFQKQLMLRLDVRVYLPNDFIMREGEVDDEFYMINRGYCELSRAINRFERVTNTMISSKSFPNGFSSSTARCNGARRRYSSLNTSGLDSGHRQSAYELDAAQRRHYSNIGRRGAKGYEIMISRGQAFGDLALLMNYQRAANVTAITHVEMCVLARADFQAVLARYPDDRYGVIVDMLTSYMQSYEANQTRCPLLELVRSVYSPEAISDACMKAGVPLPQFPGKLTARQAAERIYKAINVELQDSTLKFGIGVNVREQLVGLRERRHQKRLARHPVGPIPTKNMSIASKDCGNLISARQKNESECEENDRSIGSTPTTMPKQTPDGHIQTPLKSPKQPALSWQARLQRVEETELVILRALQDLQVNFKLLQSQQSVPAHRTMPESLLHARATP
ncbi:unnamed protein product [Phytophthora lilii]|uniref:Unnamed protein product n=1 Tax=Phytophthora lilii TaxID=2077276 RepID=A0A9W6TLX0_9STRA|nr:unnamed protein product [Phytophthora lilii]